MINEAVKKMLERYKLSSVDSYTRALKEIIQEISLLGLWRARFFERAAFYGGTALRLLHGLDRFSEDLDFSLLKPEPDFNIETYTKAVSDELLSFGFIVTVEKKQKATVTGIESAFVKAGTKENLLVIEAPHRLSSIKNAGSERVLKVKIEVDIEPPGAFETEAEYLWLPIPFSVNVYRKSDLFAGKMHAVLCRGWKNRIKGRDWYDFVWFVCTNSRLNLTHLEARMKQSGHLPGEESLIPEKFRELLFERIQTIDFERAREDVLPFLSDSAAVDIWGQDFFQKLSRKIEFESRTG
jgi:hypothetical protein